MRPELMESLDELYRKLWEGTKIRDLNTNRYIDKDRFEREFLGISPDNQTRELRLRSGKPNIGIFIHRRPTIQGGLVIYELEKRYKQQLAYTECMWDEVFDALESMKYNLGTRRQYDIILTTLNGDYHT